jgi:hypothetical protein
VAKDLSTRLQLRHVAADHLNAPGHVEARNRVLWFAQPVPHAGDVGQAAHVSRTWDGRSTRPAAGGAGMRSVEVTGAPSRIASTVCGEPLTEVITRLPDRASGAGARGPPAQGRPRELAAVRRRHMGNAGDQWPRGRATRVTTQVEPSTSSRGQPTSRTRYQGVLLDSQELVSPRQSAGQPVTVKVADATMPLWRPLAWKVSFLPG